MTRPLERLIRVVVPAALVVLATVSAAQGKDRREARVLQRSQLPAGFAVGSGTPVLALQVEVVDGAVAASSPAAAGAGNLRATRSGDASEPTLTVKSDLPVAIKFDLYLSADGERFEYTSSCALTPGISSFEMWQRPVRDFAIGNPRVVDGGRIRCD